MNLISAELSAARKGRRHYIRPMVFADGSCLSVQASPVHMSCHPQTLTPGIKGWELVEVDDLCGFDDRDLDYLGITDGPGPFCVEAERLSVVADWHGGIEGTMGGLQWRTYNLYHQHP